MMDPDRNRGWHGNGEIRHREGLAGARGRRVRRRRAHLGAGRSTMHLACTQARAGLAGSAGRAPGRGPETITPTAHPAEPRRSRCAGPLRPVGRTGVVPPPPCPPAPHATADDAVLPLPHPPFFPDPGNPPLEQKTLFQSKTCTTTCGCRRGLTPAPTLWITALPAALAHPPHAAEEEDFHTSPATRPA